MARRKEIIHADIKKHNKVTESNTLVRMPYKLELNEQKLVLALASKVHPDDTNFKFYSFKVTELADLFGICQKSAYTEIRKIIEGILKKPIRITNINKRGKQNELIINWFASAEYIQDQGRIEIEFSDKMKPFFINLKGCFTSFKLEYAVNMKSAYSIRLYTLCQEILKNKYEDEEIISLDKLKGILNIKDKYKKFHDFKRTVLDQAKKEIDLTDVVFNYEPIKEGRSVQRILFKVKKKSTQLINNITSDIPNNKEDIVKELKLFGIEDKIISIIIQNKSDDYLLENIKIIKENFLNGKIKSNLAGYAISAIKNDFRKKESPTEKEHNKNKFKAESLYKETEERVEQEIQDSINNNKNLLDENSKLGQVFNKFKDKVKSSQQQLELTDQEDEEIKKVISDLKDMIETMPITERTGAYIVQSKTINDLIKKYPNKKDMINRLMMS